MSGINYNGSMIRKGAPDAIRRLVEGNGRAVESELSAAVERIARDGGTPLSVASDGRAVGVVHLVEEVD